MSSPFDFINNISTSTNSIWDDASDKEWNAFLINRGLSQYYDTVLFAQEMNQKSQYISPRMAYDFYRLGITTKKKRFAKWHKAEKLEQIEKLAKHFGLNTHNMEQYASLLSEDKMHELNELLNVGGRNVRK